MTVEEWLGKDNKLGIDIWNRKYRYNDESFDEWLDRVSGGDERLKDLIKEKKFMFGGRTTANRNTGKKATMMNCYSRGFVEDSLEDIMQVNTDIAMTFKAQGGQGLSLSKLRPKGCGINKGQFKSDGIIPFMEIFNRTTESISQGGSRKGALLIGLDIWHKEAEDFIKIKSEQGKIQKANLSLEIDDKFMECVNNYYETGVEDNVIIDRDYNGNHVCYCVIPIKLYKLMMEKAYDWGEPGCIFTNRFRNYNLMEFCDDYNIEICNPCGEQPLAKNAACDLGSLNLSEFVEYPFTPEANFKFIEFGEAIDIAVEALDKIIDENKDNHALPEQRDMSLNYRNIGLGTMGMWDMLCKLNMKYGSEDSKKFIDDLYSFMFKRAVIASSKLAEKYGTFPMYSDNVLKSSIIKKHFSDEDLEVAGIRKNGLRNCSVLSIAPTGSIGTMLNISTGCEPAFQISYKRKTESLNGKDKYYDVYVGLANEYKKMFGEEVPLPDTFVSALDINWKDRIDIQSILQEHVDTGISSTINLPHDISLDEIEQLYLYAWKSGLKGVTIYRDGCERSGILTTEESNKTETVDNTPKELKRGMIIKADDNCIGRKRTLNTGCGTLHCEAFFDPVNGDLLETYFSKGSKGGCVDADTEYFNGNEWKKISGYRIGSGERVLQYNEKNGSAELVVPDNYIVNDDVDSLKHFESDFGLDMVLSEDHRIFAYTKTPQELTGVRSPLTTKIVTVSDYLNSCSNKEMFIPTTFSYKAEGIPLSDNLIRLFVAAFAEGIFYEYNFSITLTDVKMKARLRELLSICDEEYNIEWIEISNNIYDNTEFIFRPLGICPDWFKYEHFTNKWYECSDEQLKVIIDECALWNGIDDEENSLEELYFSDKEGADFIQFALARLGYRATIISDYNTDVLQECYKVKWTKQTALDLGVAQVEDYKTVDGHSYCFTVPSGLLILRRNNNIFVTGNCNNFMIGLSRLISLAARGGVDIYSIVDQLKSSGTCPSYAVRAATRHDTSRGSCCPVAIGNALLDMYNELQSELNDDEDIEKEADKPKNIPIKASTRLASPKCPECGGDLIFEGGCNTCKDCGWSKCD